MSRREPPRARSRRGLDVEETGATSRVIAGTVAVVGFPNVGKSTLVNRLTATRETVVHEQPGVTRDRKELEVEWRGRRVRIVDTGGIDVVTDDPLTRQVVEQARQAVAEADLALFVIDARAGLGAGDQEVAGILRKARIPVIVVANKLDNPRANQDVPELYALGLGEPVEVSALHGHGTGDLLDVVLERLAGVEGAEHEERISEQIGVAILGRPNVGKSSLLNALLGAPRTVVSDVPGTTRDAIDTLLERDGTVFRLIDTAGLRRTRRVRQDVEYWSEVRALAAARTADVALVLVDAAEGLVEQDLSVADQARKASCATIVVVAKWDVQELDLDDLRARIDRKLRQRPVVVTTSAVTGRGLERLLRTIEEVYARYTSRYPTPALNRLLADAQARLQPPLVGNRRLKILYGAQVQTRPPRFRLTVNDRRLVTRDYAYYLENRVREAAGLEGCPVILDMVARS
jgi:GTP-binding protein